MTFSDIRRWWITARNKSAELSEIRNYYASEYVPPGTNLIFKENFVPLVLIFTTSLWLHVDFDFVRVRCEALTMLVCLGTRRTVCLTSLVFICLHFGKAYVVDDSSGLGPKFDGIGGLSGGGVRSHIQYMYIYTNMFASRGGTLAVLPPPPYPCKAYLRPPSLHNHERNLV